MPSSLAFPHIRVCSSTFQERQKRSLSDRWRREDVDLIIINLGWVVIRQKEIKQTSTDC